MYDDNARRAHTKKVTNEAHKVNERKRYRENGKKANKAERLINSNLSWSDEKNQR